MFKIILPGDHAANRDCLDAMHQLRDRVVVGEWGWEIPGARPGYEIDRFDTGNTVYIVVKDDGGVSACARLNPTTRPHMMSELFTDYCDLQPVPVGEDTWECSRFVIDTASFTSPLDVFQLRCRLGIGITTWCLDEGIRRLTWLTHQRFYNHVCGLFRTEPLGTPRRQGDGWAWIAAVSDVGIDALDRQLERYRLAPGIVATLLAGKAPSEGGQAA